MKAYKFTNGSATGPIDESDVIEVRFASDGLTLGKTYQSVYGQYQSQYKYYPVSINIRIVRKPSTGNICKVATNTQDKKDLFFSLFVREHVLT